MREIERKIEFEWIVDEWVATEYQLIAGTYQPVERITGLSLDDVIRMI